VSLLLIIPVIVLYLRVPPASVLPDSLEGLFTWIQRGSQGSFTATFGPPAYAEFWPVGLCLLGAIAFLVGATGLPSYFVYSRRSSIVTQNHAIALSYYAATPLVLWLMPSVLVILCLSMKITWTATIALAVAIGVLSPFLIWWILAMYLAYAAGVRRNSLAAAMFLLPVCWVSLAAMTLLAIPIVVIYLLLVAGSMI
jgi:hypothetical protein